MYVRGEAMDIDEIYERIYMLKIELNEKFYIDYASGKRNNINTIKLSQELDTLIALYTKAKLGEKEKIYTLSTVRYLEL